MEGPNALRAACHHNGGPEEEEDDDDDDYERERGPNTIRTNKQRETERQTTNYGNSRTLA